MRARVRQFIKFFINLFFLANFVVGSMVYLFVPNKMSPVPESSTMFLIGIATAGLAFISILHGK
jgi:hypothetical protein